ncbi:hypothetical protein ABZX51_007614 [Aspergillus tubingensis]
MVKWFSRLQVCLSLSRYSLVLDTPELHWNPSFSFPSKWSWTHSVHSLFSLLSPHLSPIPSIHFTLPGFLLTFFCLWGPNLPIREGYLANFPGPNIAGEGESMGITMAAQRLSHSWALAKERNILSGCDVN